MSIKKHFVLAALMSAAVCPCVVQAESGYPSRPIKIVVVNAAGGTDDAISRVVAGKISKDLGQPVIVENRGGGSGTIGASYVASAQNDGYTIMCLPGAGIVQTVLREKLHYSLNSFAPIVGIGSFPVALAVSTTAKPKITSLQNLTTAARTEEGVTFASGGIGTMGHLTAVRLLSALKGKGVHVTYKNNAESLQALMGGFTQIMFASASEVSAVRGDKLQVLGVAASQRAVNLPDVPTFKELGMPNFDASLWYGFVAPAGTRPEITKKLSDAIIKAVRDPDFINHFKPLAFQEDIKTGAALKSYIDDEAKRYKQVVVDNKIKLD